MAGAASLRSRVEEARTRRDEASEGFLSRVAKKQEPQPDPKPQGPARQIERPSMQREAPTNLGRQEPVRQREIPVPPRPNVMPEITPVAATKNTLAREQKYSDEAKDILYNTPTQVRYSPFGMGDKALGYYYPSERTDFENGSFTTSRPADSNPYHIEIIKYDDFDNPQKGMQKVFAHEFAHKWDREQVPLTTSNVWKENWTDIASPYAYERTKARNLKDYKEPIESYAHNAERGPSAIPDYARNYHYPGLYRDDVVYNPPVPERPRYQLLSDEEHSRPFGAWDLPPRAYDASRWVLPEGVSNYYEDGFPIRHMEMPTQWERPRWPSLRLYSESGR
jgi:hypothetical protein